MKRKIQILLLLAIVFSFGKAMGQVELVPVGNQVYDFLKRMQVKGLITEFNSASLPISREEVSDMLLKVNKERARLSGVDRKMLEDYLIEFEYDARGTLKSSTQIFQRNFNTDNLFGNKKQKYVYDYSDSNATFFLDVMGTLSQRQSSGDSIGGNQITLGEIGFRARGTLYNMLGYYLRVSNGQKLKGEEGDILFAINTDPTLKGNTKFVNEKKNFDTYEGYLRFRTKGNWLAITLGKEALTNGFGYIDKMFLSTNTVPFSFGKIDLKYKALSYSFTYGSLKGDSLGIEIPNKSIALHRLDIQAAKNLRFGAYESIIISSTAFSFIYINPLSFLISADLNAGADETTKNNALLGIDFEYVPFRTLAIQGTFLIDDLNLSTLGSKEQKDYYGDENKFGYQAGIYWTDAFTLPAVTLSMEYTRLNPFVYSHRSNKNGYTNWDMSLGHALQPNSDEIALRLNFPITNRITLDFIYQHQRSGGGYLLDSLGNVKYNYGGDINRGDKDYILDNTFLMGNRVNRDIFWVSVLIQPIKQYYLEFKANYNIQDLLYADKTVKDFYWFLTARIDF